MPRLYINGEWRDVDSSATFPIINLSKSYKSQYLEGALEEIASWNYENQASINSIKSTLSKHQSEIDYLKEHGGGGTGGGGGTTLPTITSTIESPIIIDPNDNLELSIFFSSPNLGEGLAYILFDDVETDTISVKQGNNILNLGKMSNLQTKISVYVRDRSNLMSNMITWNVISGGIDLTLNFDYEADYMIGDEIYMDYEVSSAITNPITLKVNIDGDNYEQSCEQGFNSYDLSDLSVGVHAILIYATDGTYKSTTYEFNVVVINSDSLYLSTTFKGGEYDYGVPIMINYRISDGSLRKFDVKLYIDDNLYKTLSSSRGSYYWTITDTAIGKHTFKIEVSADEDYKMVEGSFDIVEGDYTPLSINTQGLVFRLDPSTKTNQDIDRANPSFNGINMNLYGFNFSSNGWVNGELVCDGGAYAVIDYSPWSDNATRGSTIEIYYKCSDIGKDKAKVIDYSDTKSEKGFSIGLDQCSIRSISNTGIGFVNPDKYIKVSFVIDRSNKFAHVYINGVCSRSFKLNDTGSGVSAIYEDFSHDGKIYINCDKLIENIGSCSIKEILIYRRTLNKDEILKNTLAHITDMSVQKINYNFEFNNSTLSKMKMYGNTEGMSLYQANTMRLKYESANTEKYGQSFDLPYCSVKWQGTSSVGYTIKNYQATLYDSDMKEYLYSPYPNGILESIFCFKADYMESSHGRNVGIAKFLNDCIYTTKNPAQLKDDKVRNAINGFPMLMYINDELIGIYNFNTDRYSSKTYGYIDEENTLVYEISANSDSTAGAFFKWTEGNGDELDYYRSDFTCLYPPTRAAGNDNYTEIKALVVWISDASDEDFKENIEKHFNKEYLIRYLIYVNLMGAVDSLGKNMKLASWDGGNVWYIQPYDCDTSIGLDNSGDLRFDPDIEIGEADTFNTTASRLWEKVMRVFEEDIKAEYAKLRKTTLTLDNLYKYILDEQINLIPKYYYNRDMQNKYLDHPTWLYALHGDAGSFIEQWLKDRLLYIDTLYGYDASISDFITLRASKYGNVYLDIQTFSSMYFTIKWTNKAGDIQKLRVKKGETVRFSAFMSTATDQEIIIYGGKYIKSLGDLSNLQPATLSLANASKLTELVCHSEKLYNTDISSCYNLTKLDLSDCVQLGTGLSAQPILNVSKCNNLEYVNCNNTEITEVQLNPKGSNIKELILSKSTQTITLNNCPNLNTVSLEQGHRCKNIDITDCPELKFGEGNSSDLSGIVKLKLNNSCNNLKEIIIQDTTNLSNVEIYNNSSIERIKFGLQVFDEQIPYTIAKAKTGEDITIKAIRATALKELIVSGYGRQSSSEFITPTRGENSPITKNQYDTFLVNNLDISETAIETINLLAASLIYNLKIPNTIKNIRCNSYYDTIRTAWNGLEGVHDSCIFNIFNPNINELTSDNVWDLNGLEINDFDILNICTEEQCLISMKNINAKCINYPLSFNCHSNLESPEGTIDYSNYKGTTLEYAFSNSNSDKLQIILPETFETVEDFTRAFYNCNQNWSWSDVATMISNAPKLKTIGDFTFSKATLDNSSNVIFKSTNKINIGQNLFEESNLNNIDEFNFPNGTQIYDDAYDYGIFNRSNIQTIGNINLFAARLKYMFMRSSNLFSIGDINITNNLDTSAELMCGYCSKLQKIGNIDTSNIEIFNNSFRECTQLQTLILDVSKAINMDYMCYGNVALSLVTLNNLEKNTTLSTINYAFFRCVMLAKITGAETYPSSLTSARSTYMNCNSLKEAPMLPAILTGYLIANYMCYSTALTKIGNLPERLTSASYMFRNTSITDENIVLPSTLTTASYMLSNVVAKTLSINIPEGCNNIDGILDSVTSEVINLNMADPLNKRSMIQFVGSNNPNLVELNNVNMYNSTGFDYMYCPNLNIITFTSNSEIIDSFNISNTKLNLTTIEKIINILWDATGWEEYEDITKEDGTVVQVKKVKTLSLGRENMNTLRNSPRGDEILAIGVNKNWTISA